MFLLHVINSDSSLFKGTPSSAMHILLAVGGICCVFMSVCLNTPFLQPIPQVVKGGAF